MNIPNAYLFRITKKGNKFPIVVIEIDIDKAIEKIRNELGKYELEFIAQCSVNQCGNIAYAKEINC